MGDRTRRHGGRLVERTDRATVATFFAADPLVVGGTVTLSEEAAHHIRVARVAVGELVALRDGAGRAAVGTLVKVSKKSALVGVPMRTPITIALGPEGGMEPAERDLFIGAAFLPVKLGPGTLRFETAGVAAVAIAAASLA